MLVFMENTRNKGGRPRKDSTEKKLHRVQVAMSDAELAAARRLAAMLDTSVSAAIASYAVPVALRAKTVDQLAERILHELTAAAKHTAERSDTPAWSAAEGQHVLVVHFVGSAGAHKALQTPWKRMYDEALESHARRYAERAVAVMYSDYNPAEEVVPYSAEKTVVLFSFASESRIEKLYRYYQPIDWTDGSFAQPPSDVE